MKNSPLRAAQGAAIEADPRWAKIVGRDKGSDGAFVYSVKTTGVYCRPSCAARLANPANVRFHATPAEARAAGFRACKRCKPDLGRVAPHAAKVAEAARRIAASETLPSLSSLAAKAGLSPYHFHRVFKAVTGLTPRDYAAAHRGKKLREQLHDGASVTQAIYDAGYNSGSRFYEKSKSLLGMTPSRYKAGGTDEEIRFAIAKTSLGALLVAASDKGVCAILLGDDPEKLLRELQDRFSKARLMGGDAKFEKLVARVVGLVEHPRKGLDLPLDIRGTAFQQRVWKALAAIPAGKTRSYADIARKIGMPKAVRAVAQACASNTLAVAIPCHRVVKTDGGLSGYRWGVARKEELLRREEAA
ncbi:MAG TPA: bifunctional DNA-binding transcriptional regulator/O6-methylguanine-DNA methyltransferase Ada [Rhizomicrobium sp.]|nr:bifunctional DNA-binding transcriptional regulator/O6-methylguanine-DNA methyltransferase Ada [Rhizomicrobium sp.]